jgi:WD repeat-containing protein 1 (actin-interacting protein 1)
VTSLAYSSQGKLLAAGHASGKIVLFTVVAGEYSLLHEKFSFHTSRIMAMEFSPGGGYLASGGLDSDVYVWKVEATVGGVKRVQVKGAHGEGVWGVRWLGEGRVVSTGADAAVKIWDVTI